MLVLFPIIIFLARIGFSLHVLHVDFYPSNFLGTRLKSAKFIWRVLRVWGILGLYPYRIKKFSILRIRFRSREPITAGAVAVAVREPRRHLLLLSVVRFFRGFGAELNAYQAKVSHAPRGGDDFTSKQKSES